MEFVLIFMAYFVWGSFYLIDPIDCGPIITPILIFGWPTWWLVEATIRTKRRAKNEFGG